MNTGDNFIEMASVPLQFNFNGEAVADGVVDADVLVPALTALYGLIGEANDTANEGRAKVRVRVRAFREGSFESHLEVVQGYWAHAADLLTGKNSTAISTLLSYVGFATPIVGPSVFYLIRKFKGRRPERVEKNPDGTFTLARGDVTEIVNGVVAALYQSESARKKIGEMVAPLKQDGIDSISFAAGDSEPAVIWKRDLPSFVYTAMDAEQAIDITRRRARVRIEQVDFNVGNKWKFSQQGAKFYAKITDEDFNADFEKGVYSFGPGSGLEVELETQTLMPENRIIGFAIPKVYDVLKTVSDQQPLPL